ncbi:MAG: hypothetical protein JSS60_00075 [Verrucomicrobia bacterium]|nr:hypothetical protein [Verrucomicrobiota bacterium]
MNAFKLGQSAASSSYVFSGDKYFSVLSGGLKTFVPKTTSVVYYPSQYSKIYSLDGTFAQMLKGVFSLQGQWDPEKKVTTWVVGSKK